MFTDAIQTPDQSLARFSLSEIFFLPPRTLYGSKENFQPSFVLGLNFFFLLFQVVSFCFTPDPIQTYTHVIIVCVCVSSSLFSIYLCFVPKFLSLGLFLSPFPFPPLSFLKRIRIHILVTKKH